MKCLSDLFLNRKYPAYGPVRFPGRPPRYFMTFLACCGLLFSHFAYSQRKSGWDKAVADALKKNPALLTRWLDLERGRTLGPAQARLRGQYRQTGTVVIPIVVHIVLQNPSLVSDSAVFSQIAVLNRDYTASDPDTSDVPQVWKPIIGNAQMEFCLAQRDPQDDPSTGILRVTTPVGTFSINNACSDVKHAATGGSDAWADSEYLNIWVCNLESGYLGVTTPYGLYPDNEQGVVIQYNAFGTVGNLQAHYNLGRTTTHEIGHYFNLLHPWGAGDGTCSPGDYVGDTPPQYGPVYGCPAFPFTDQCSPDSPGVQFVNFMEYTDDDCMHMFSQGQVSRMEASLYDQRASLLTSRGCLPVLQFPLDASILTVEAPTGKICNGQVNPLVVLKNRGTDTLRSVTLNYQVDSGAVSTISWAGSLNPFDTLQISLPGFQADTGAHILTVFTSGPNGQQDQQPANDTGRSSFHLDPLAILPFSEGFEDTIFPPSGWVVVNPDDSYTWQRTTAASHSGSASAVIRNFVYTVNGPVDDLETPVFQINGADSAYLSFYVAAAVQSPPYTQNNPWDTLEVLISTDCGQSGDLRYQHWGLNLITDSAEDQAEFVPAPDQWRKDSVNLTPYIGQGNFQLIFRNICNNENDIYLDDIQVYTKNVNPNLAAQGILVVPNPTTGQVLVEFLNTGNGLQGVDIYNVQGQLVASQPVTAITDNRLVFNLANAADGAYFVRIIYAHKTIVREILKLK